MQESQWFTVNYGYASKVLQDVVSNYKKYLAISRKQPQHIKDNFSLEGMRSLFCKYVDKGSESVPQQMSLQLPKLKKVGTNAPKVKLPTLKKVKL